MFKILIVLAALVSGQPIVFGIPTDFDDFHLEAIHEELNATDLGHINQVADFSPFNANAGPKKFTVVAYQAVNWFAAHQLCSRFGLSLASLTSVAEEAQMRQYLIENGLSDEYFWISANKLSGQTKWFWLSNGNAVTHTNWFPNEPNNVGGQENCVVVKYPEGKWNDLNCQNENYFICENRCPLNSYDVPLYPQNQK